MRGNGIFNSSPALVIVAGLLTLVASTQGCEDRPPTAPSPQPTPVPLSVLSITPTTGSTASPIPVTIRGTGFLPGATVTLGGPATPVTVVGSTIINTTAPASQVGTVDVVVTNPDGQSGRLTGGFQFVVTGPYSVTASTTTIVAGGPLTVTWTAPRGGAFDWIGFFLVGESSTNYEFRWWKYTDGAVSGQLPLTAPLIPGQYEFRYLLDDGYVDVARSVTVTVTAQ